MAIHLDSSEPEVVMKIGVSGASGHLGRAVVSTLLQRADGHEVVAPQPKPIFPPGNYSLENCRVRS